MEKFELSGNPFQSCVQIFLFKTSPVPLPYRPTQNESVPFPTWHVTSNMESHRFSFFSLDTKLSHSLSLVAFFMNCFQAPDYSGCFPLSHAPIY